MSLREISNEIGPVLLAYGVTHAGVFGSVARGTDRPDSDLDLLIDLKEPIGVFRLVGLKQELEERLNRSVDVVVREALDRRVAPFVEADMRPLPL